MLDIFIIFFGIILLVFFLAGLVYIARYEWHTHKDDVRAKMPQGRLSPGMVR